MAAVLTAISLSALFVGPPKQVHKTVPLAPDGRLFVRNSEGTVEVTAWDLDEVEVDARIEPRNPLAAERACLAGTDVRVDAWPRSVRIVPEYAFVDSRVPRLVAALFGQCTEQPLVHYRIKAPRRAEVVIVSGQARVSATGLAGRVEVRSEARQ
jgi:hypothetical protein